MVQAHRTSSNLLEPQHDRDSRECKGYSYEFGVVRLCRTFSNLIFTGQARCEGCLSTSSGWFKYVHRTSSNHLEPPHRRENKVCRVFSHVVRVVRLYGTFSNYIFTEERRCAGCLYTSSGWFKRIEPPRTISNYNKTEIAGRVEFFHMSSGWFDYAEPSLT